VNRLVVALLVLTVVPTAFAAGVRQSVREGNELFERGDYEGALERYTDAEVDQPELPRVALNIGAALYEQGKFEEAFTRFQPVAQEGEFDLAALAYYNVGNCAFKLGKLEEALGFYKKSIQLDPTDIDAKFNYELTQKMLEQREQEQESPEDDEEETDNQTEQGPQEDATPTPSPSGNEQHDQELEGTQPQGEGGPSPAPDPSSPAEAQASPVPSELTEEQLQQLLDYLADKEAAHPQPLRRLRDYPEPERNW